MATARRFPVPEHVMWTNCLENLPHISNDTVADLINQAPTSSKQQTKSYAFAVEAYTLPSSVVTNACDTSLGIVYARATCYRSQKKSGQPYKVSLALKSDSGAVADSTCECPAGAGGACSHILAALRLIVLLKQKGFKEAPPELSCTELPQQWRRPDDKASGLWPCRTWTGGVHVRVAWACQCPCNFLMRGLRSKRSSNTLKRSIAWKRTSRASGPSTLLPFSLLLGGRQWTQSLGLRLRGLHCRTSRQNSLQASLRGCHPAFRKGQPP
ncbi:hypothetical protein HPB51_000728 [Rhipicephalus microplus]|uniref:SWIM-type domain-containing protein n=1 Tax=Rhipicephalus microplus TaxID=6941 RepID=A0A9J6E5E8_RHIMP|nr:hypothetical protein HPB51_000728 [Rhipicephalus microplus]